MDESQEYYAKWKSPDPRLYILYYLIYDIL